MRGEVSDAPGPVGGTIEPPAVSVRDGGTDAVGAAALETVLRYRRRTLVFGSFLVATSFAIDLIQPRLREVAIARVLWIGAILACAAAQRPDRPRLATIASYLGALATGIAVTVIVGLSGGTASLYEGMFIATPFTVLVAMFELPGAAALTGALCVIGGAVIRHGEGQSTAHIVSWLLLSTVMSALATWGTVAARRAWRAEVAAERARTEAAERLAEFERQRADVERMAEVGRIAAIVAHELNSPLAVVKANVRWLGAYDPGRDAAERDEVVADTLECVERMVEAVRSLRGRAGELPQRKG